MRGASRRSASGSLDKHARAHRGGDHHRLCRRRCRRRRRHRHRPPLPRCMSGSPASSRQSRLERGTLLVCSAARLLPTPQVVRNETAKKKIRRETDGDRGWGEGEWKTARYRPFPGPLSIATPSRLRLRHVICATVGSWNFVSPKITPVHGPSKEGREATRRTAYTRSPSSWTENPRT